MPPSGWEDMVLLIIRAFPGILLCFFLSVSAALQAQSLLYLGIGGSYGPTEGRWDNVSLVRFHQGTAQLRVAEGSAWGWEVIVRKPLSRRFSLESGLTYRYSTFFYSLKEALPGGQSLQIVRPQVRMGAWEIPLSVQVEHKLWGSYLKGWVGAGHQAVFSSRYPERYEVLTYEGGALELQQSWLRDPIFQSALRGTAGLRITRWAPMVLELGVRVFHRLGPEAEGRLLFQVPGGETGRADFSPDKTRWEGFFRLGWGIAKGLRD